MRLAVWIVCLAACGSAPPPAPKPAAPAGGMPAEVSTLLERWESCWHFRGEEATSPERQQEILAGQDKWCPGNEAELARLRAKYAAQPDVMKALAKTDEQQ